MGEADDAQAVTRRSEFLQALTTEHFALQGARSATISESAARSSLYMTSLSSAVVALALVGQVSKLGPVFQIFALVILPVVFFLGLVTYARLMQTGVEDAIYENAIVRIHSVYESIDPSQAEFFRQTHVSHAGLAAVGLFRLRWQQFISAAATVAVINSVVGGAFLAIVVANIFKPRDTWIAIVIGAAGTLVFAVVILRHQWRTWMRVSAALPKVG
jgi:hypothetical protein